MSERTLSNHRNMCLQHVFDMLIDNILVYYTVGSLTFFEQYRYAKVEYDW